MPLNRFVLLLVSVIAAAGITVWLGTLAAGSFQGPAAGWMTIVPVMLAGYVAWRVIAARIGNAQGDDHDDAG